MRLLAAGPREEADGVGGGRRVGAADDIVGPLVSELEREELDMKRKILLVCWFPTLCKAKWFAK
jgi:hypothetical protein